MLKIRLLLFNRLIEANYLKLYIYIYIYIYITKYNGFMISSSNWKPHFHDYGSKDTNDIFYSFYSLGLLRSTIQWFSLKNWLLNSSQWVCYGNSDHQDNLAEKKACKAMDTISTIRNVKSFRHWLFSSNKNVKQNTE